MSSGSNPSCPFKEAARELGTPKKSSNTLAAHATNYPRRCRSQNPQPAPRPPPPPRETPNPTTTRRRVCPRAQPCSHKTSPRPLFLLLLLQSFSSSSSSSPSSFSSSSSSALPSTTTTMNAGDDAMVPDHLVCCVCLDAPAGRVEQSVPPRPYSVRPPHGGGRGRLLPGPAAGARSRPEHHALVPCMPLPAAGGTPAQPRRGAGNLAAARGALGGGGGPGVVEPPKDLRHPTRKRPCGSCSHCGGSACQILLATSSTRILTPRF